MACLLPQIAAKTQAQNLANTLHGTPATQRDSWLNFRAIIGAGEVLDKPPPHDVLYIEDGYAEHALQVVDQLIASGVDCNSSVVVFCEAGLYRRVKAAAAIALVYKWRQYPKTNLDVACKQIATHYTECGKDVACIESGLKMARKVIAGAVPAPHAPDTMPVPTGTTTPTVR